MRISFRATRRLPPVPAWAAAAMLGWAGLVLAIGLLARARGLGRITTCWMKDLLGIPCPTCGGTRAALAVLAGRPIDALVLNPLLTVAGGLGLAWLVARLALGRSPAIELTRGERWAAAALGAAGLAANWAYLIAAGR